MASQPDLKPAATRRRAKTNATPRKTFYQRISKTDVGLFHIDLIIEIYAETFAVTFQVHRNERRFFNEEESLSAVSSANSTEERVAAAMRLLIDDGKDDSHVLATASFAQIDSIQKSLYEEFWRDIDDKMKEAWGAVGYGGDSAGYQLIAEFRGVCLTTRPLLELQDRAKRRTQSHEHYSLDAVTSPHAQLQDNPQASSSALSFINRRRGYFARFLGYSSAVADVTRPPEGANAVMCGMLDGLAVYAASFRAEGESPRSLPNYVRYKVVFTAASSNQLGRLVLRIHRSGISRVCALIDARQIDFCSNEIRRIGLAIGGSSHATAGQTPETREGRREAINQANVRLRAALNSCRGGLRFRIAQSRYYASRLSHTIRDLRIVRIGGWQTYDDFLKRHLFGQLEKIDRLGYRLDDLSRRIDQEQSALLSEDLVSYNESTAEHTKAMVEANSRVAAATDKISAANQELVELQFTAEVFAFVAAGYYLPGILTVAFKFSDQHKQMAYGTTASLLLMVFLLRNRRRIYEFLVACVLQLRGASVAFARDKGHGEK